VPDAFGGRADRAKQFMPFATLRGYYKAVRESERIVEPRRYVTEEDVARISATLAGVRKGDMVRVTYYDKDAYVVKEVMVSEVVPALQFITIVRTQIAFDDIWDVEAL